MESTSQVSDMDQQQAQVCQLMNQKILREKAPLKDLIGVYHKLELSINPERIPGIWKNSVQ